MRSRISAWRGSTTNRANSQAAISEIKTVFPLETAWMSEMVRHRESADALARGARTSGSSVHLGIAGHITSAAGDRGWPNNKRAPVPVGPDGG